MYRLLLFTFVFLSPAISYPQNGYDFPSDLPYFKNNSVDTTSWNCQGQSQKQWQIFGDSMVKEFYCGGNIHAEGSVVVSEITSYKTEDNKEAINKEYSKQGYWKVYYDSYDKIIRSEGNYKNDKRDGAWTIYFPNGSHNHEIIYVDGIIKKHIEIDETGKRTVFVSNSDVTIFIIKNESLLIVLLLIQLMLIRPFFNFITYYKVNKNNYIPTFQKWQRAAWEALMTFWWMPRKHETKSVRTYIIIANTICIISILMTLAFILLYTFWGPSKQLLSTIIKVFLS